MECGALPKGRAGPTKEESYRFRVQVSGKDFRCTCKRIMNFLSLGFTSRSLNKAGLVLRGLRYIRNLACSPSKDVSMLWSIRTPACWSETRTDLSDSVYKAKVLSTFQSAVLHCIVRRVTSQRDASVFFTEVGLLSQCSLSGRLNDHFPSVVKTAIAGCNVVPASWECKSSLLSEFCGQANERYHKLSKKPWAFLACPPSRKLLVASARTPASTRSAPESHPMH